MEVNKSQRKTIENFAPSIRVKIYNFETKQLESVVTQGWKIGCMAIVPDSDFYLAEWEIIHQPSGYRMMTGRCDRTRLLNPYICSENGKYMQYHDSLRSPLMAKIVASWLSGFDWGDPITKQSLQKAKDTIFSEFGIRF